MIATTTHQPPGKRKVRRWMRYALLLFVAWFIGHTVYVVVDGTRDDGRPADLAVILGNTVRPDGTLSKRLEARLSEGLALYRAGRVPRLLVSGGLGKEGFWEAEKMRAYLRAGGVPDSCIVVDNRGNTTAATVANTLALRDSLGFRSLIVVSQYFHLTRCKKLFRKRGFSAVAGCALRYFEWRDLYALPREFLAYYLS